jgi:hypothetical protein
MTCGTVHGMFRNRLEAVYYGTRRWQPRTHTQAWLSAATLPLGVGIIGLVLRLVFHTWPQFSGVGTAGAIGYVLVRGTARSRAVNRRRRAQATLADPE